MVEHVDPAAFARDLLDISEKLRLTVDKAVRYTGFQVLAHVDPRSPVDTGRFRANWAFGDSPSLAPLPEGDYGAQAGATRITVLPSDDPFRTLWIYNNLPYAEALEFGHSKQAPGGVARLAVAEVAERINATRIALGNVTIVTQRR